MWNAQHVAPSLLAVLTLTLPCPGQQFAAASDGHLPPSELPTRQVAVGDVDGDGDRDLVMTVWARPPRLLLNDGRGSFVLAPPTNMPSGIVTAAEIVLADMDGDHDLDLVIADLDGQDRLFLNDGRARFTDVTSTHIPLRDESSYAVEVGDVDGDRDLDILLGTPSAVPEILLLNDGKGRFRDVTATNLPRLTFHPYSPGVVLGDFDGDRDLDCFLANRANPNRLYLNDGKGVFRDASASLPVLPIGGPIAAADVDGDGDLDVVGAFFAGPNRLLLNDGKAGFTDATANLPSDRDSTSDVDLQDVDGDRDIDVVFTNLHASQRCKLLLNDGKGKFRRGSDLAGNMQEAAIADLDRNGTADVVFAGPRADIYFGDGRGGFTGAARKGLPHQPRDYVAAAAAGDFDGDGSLDIVAVRGAVSGNLLLTPFADRLYLSDSYGSFTEAGSARLPSLAALTSDVAVVDVDRDGDQDIVTANSPHTYFMFLEGENHLYLNDGKGAFSLARTNMPAHRDPSAGVACGDVDANGTVDLYFANSREDRLYLGDGKGMFRDGSSQLPSIGESSSAAVLVDVDGDRDLDVVVASRMRNRLLLNDGKGNFADGSSRLPASNAQSADVAVLDIERDGDADLVFATQGPGPGALDTLYENDGKGNFRIVSGLPAVRTMAGSVTVADVDEDGDADILFGDEALSGSRHRLLLGDGRGKFEDRSSRLPALTGSTTDVVLADFDLDRDADLLSVAHGLVLLTNRLRHLDAPQVLRLSIPFTLGFYSRPGFAVRDHVVIPYLQLAAQSPPVLLEPFGLWRIQILGELPLDPLWLQAPRGTARLELRFPEMPQLIGRALHVQAWIFDSPNLLTSRFTNALREPISK